MIPTNEARAAARRPAPDAGTRTPLARRAAGSTRVLASSSASAISPRAMRRANAGAGRMVGRRRTAPSARVNSRLVTACGATALTGPLSASSASACRAMPTTSSIEIQLMYWSPEPSTPPTPSLNGSSIWPSAPPSGLSTMPMRRCTTRMPASRAGDGRRFPGAGNLGQESDARRRRFVEQLISAITVVADRRRRDQHARRRVERGQRRAQALRPVHAAVPDARLARGRPPAAGDVLSREMDHGVDAVERTGRERPVRRIPRCRIRPGRGRPPQAPHLMTVRLPAPVPAPSRSTRSTP